MLKPILITLFLLLSLSANAEYISPLIYKDISCTDLKEELIGHESNLLDNQYNESLVAVNMRPRTELPVYIKQIQTSTAHITAIKKAAKKIQCTLPEQK